MEPDFWRSRWKENRIGFHEGKPNALLMKHLNVLEPAMHLLVPLCGKAEDLAFLAAQGHDVVGVELVESAVQQFFEEHGVKPEVMRDGKFTRYSAPRLTIFAGDFFATTRELLGNVDALYDRAAIIALPEPMRAGYVKHVRSLLPKGSPGIVITVEYPQDALEGPPFSVPEAELRTHYSGAKVELVDTVKAEGPRFSAANAIEKCFTVQL
jgi:thiopurine S-methyltransferase